MKNSQKYAPPEGYYEQTKLREPSLLLTKALKLLNTDKKYALDFGCGAGSETAYLVNSGFIVTAVDANPEVAQYINSLLGSNSINFVCSDFESFNFENYDLINSSRSLPFITNSNFVDVINHLKQSLRVNGLFVGELYGIHDEWNKPNETMTFLDRDNARIILHDMEIIEFIEHEFDGQIANGNPKHWHTFQFLARKL